MKWHMYCSVMHAYILSYLYIIYNRCQAHILCPCFRCNKLLTSDMVDVTLPVLLFDGSGQHSVVHWPTRLLHMLYPVHIVTVTDY